MASKKKKVPAVGELRRSQILTSFGPGSMVDLPDHSVLIGGLEHWYGDRTRIYEDRLEKRVAETLKIDEVALYEPPVDTGEGFGPRVGIAAFKFPAWFLGQIDRFHTTKDRRRYRTRPLLPWERLVKGGYLDENRKRQPVVPIRFVQACVRGHISDINWYQFVREDPDTDNRGQLWLDEGGAGNDFTEIYIRDERTGKRRPLSAAQKQGTALGFCHGRMPWLGPYQWEKCDRPNRLLTRTASNAYFSQVITVIAIPDADQLVREGVDRVFDDFLQYAENTDEIHRERKKEKVHAALLDLSDEAVWAEVQRRKKRQHADSKPPKQAEIETLLTQPPSHGDETPGDEEFYARTADTSDLPDYLKGKIEKVVLVHRLREVMAQIGFTRFEAATPDIDGDLSLDVEPARLARETSWVPAVENRGEGIFISVSDAAIRDWVARPTVMDRGRELARGLAAHWERKKIKRRPPPEAALLPYVMLQSLSHLLITAVALECGYSASAIRERIYTGQGGHGILLYTGSPGSEGTLGGLVHLGGGIEAHIRRALERGQLCSNDPVCAQHDPADPHEERFLHGAACHGCLLIAETSCEQRNEMLDRALVVPTVATPGAAFFENIG